MQQSQHIATFRPSYRAIDFRAAPVVETARSPTANQPPGRSKGEPMAYDVARPREVAQPASSTRPSAPGPSRLTFVAYAATATEPAHLEVTVERGGGW